MSRDGSLTTKQINTNRPTVILTGPTSGLGLNLFHELIDKSYSVISLGRNLHRISEVLHHKQSPDSFIDIDFSNKTHNENEISSRLESLITTNANKHVIFISNASIIEPIIPAILVTISDLEQTLRVNCLTPLIIANALAKITSQQNKKLTIININSGAASRPISGWQAYCTSKAAYKIALDVLAEENENTSITHYDPGVMDTPMQETIRNQCKSKMPEVDLFRRYKENGALNNPNDIAKKIINIIETTIR